MVKKKVSRYSSISSMSLKVRASEGIVSIKEIIILSDIAMITQISKMRPSGLSDSNMML
jgi:hypothetical protein